MTTTPTTAQARELARELREKANKATPRWYATAHGNVSAADENGNELRNVLLCNTLDDHAQGNADRDFVVYARNHAASIAATLDALATQCERLSEELDALKAKYGQLDEANTTAWRRLLEEYVRDGTNADLFRDARA